MKRIWTAVDVNQVISLICMVLMLIQTLMNHPVAAAGYAVAAGAFAIAAAVGRG